MIEDSLFGDLDEFTLWKREWKDMPEFIQNDLEPRFSIEVHFMLKMADGKPDLKWGAARILKVNFETIEDIQKFAEALGLKGINCETTSCIYTESSNIFADKLGQKISDGVRSIWYPEAEIGKVADKLWIDKKIDNLV